MMEPPSSSIELSLLPSPTTHSLFHRPGERVSGRLFFRELKLNALYTVIIRHVGVTWWPAAGSRNVPRSEETEEKDKPEAVTNVVNGEELK